MKYKYNIYMSTGILFFPHSKLWAWDWAWLLSWKTHLSLLSGGQINSDAFFSTFHSWGCLLLLLSSEITLADVQLHLANINWYIILAQ